MIESIKMNEQELDNCFKIMRKGNTHLKTLADMTGMEQRKFRARLFKGSFNPTEWPELTTEQATQFALLMPEIEAVRNIEWKMMRQFSRLARKHANSWAKKMGGTIVDAEDYLQEALMALLDAIYGYTEDHTLFNTFAWWSIQNRLTTAANKNNPFSPLTNEAMGLLKRFEEAKQKLNRYATDQEVYEACDFTEEECQLIREAQVKVYNACAVKEHHDEQNSVMETACDYTASRSGIDNEKDTVPCHYEIREAIKRANLTEVERKVIETSLYPHYGWQSELAESTICTTTGKPYTRQRIGQVLQNALVKVKAAYLKREVA